MDPASAFQCASGAFQLASLAIDIVRIGYDLAKTDELSSAHQSLQNELITFRRVASRIDAEIGAASSNVSITKQSLEGLPQLVQSVVKAATDLEQILLRISSKGNQKRPILSRLFLTLLKSKDVTQAHNALESCRKQLYNEYIVHLRYVIGFL